VLINILTARHTTEQPNAKSALVIAVLVCALYGATEIHVIGHMGLPLDDSWIHLQFAREISLGSGLSFQDEVLMPASTAPLWTALLSLGFIFPINPVAWTWLLGAFFFVATVVGSDRLAGELGCGRRARWVASVLVATNPWLVWSALSGMEITLFAALALWGMVHHLRERQDSRLLPRCLPLLAAASLARPEGYLLLALACGERLLRFVRQEDAEQQDGNQKDSWRLLLAVPPRTWFVSLGAAGLILLPVLTFYKLHGGSFLPTTFSVKASTPSDLIPNGHYLRTVLGILFDSQPLMLLFSGAGVLRLLSYRGDQRNRGALPALWLLGLPLAYSLLTPENGPLAVGNFGRYYFPLLPVLVVLGVTGLEPYGRRLPRFLYAGPLRLPARGLAVTLLFIPQLWALVHGPLRLTQTVANVEDSDVAAAHWLANRLPSNALLAVQDIGALKYHLPNRVLDLAGLVNPEILPILRDGPDDWEIRLLHYLGQQRPDYLVVFPSSYPRLTRSPGFEPMNRFPIPENVTMAGDELVVFKTPWCQTPLVEGTL
jgi:hypothetical protein